MKRLTMLVAIFALLLLGFPQLGFADEGNYGNNQNDNRGDPGDGQGDHGDRDGAQRFGPYLSGSTDSGTCGPDWAVDTFNRVFTVSQASGTWQIREDFTNGKFVTTGPTSPGACETSGPHGLLVAAGIKGTFSGFLRGPVAGGTFNPDGGCPTPCTGTLFLSIHFGATATWDTSTFRFSYRSENETLRLNRWQNASPDQGGNRGDIATE